jgi:hypothetical protein
MEFFSFFIPVVAILFGLVIVSVCISTVLAYLIVSYRKWRINKGMQLVNSQVEQLMNVFK